MAGKLKQFYDRRYEKGLCVFCGKNPYTPGKRTCQSCRNKKANIRKAKQAGWNGYLKEEDKTWL